MFINTLPIIFTYTSLFSLIEAVIFLAAIFFLVYFYTPEVNKNWISKPGNSLYQFLYSAWLGNSALWRAFWPFFLLVNAHPLLYRLPGNERNLYHRQLENSPRNAVSAYSLVDDIGLAMLREYPS